MSTANKNPKLEGSNLIDAVPHKGFCMNMCQECYYNNGPFYLDIHEDLPLLPTLDEVGNKIVRVNSGNDSNNEKNMVLENTKQYKHKFYNTSIPSFGFPAPVVFTCNGRNTDYPEFIENVWKSRDLSNVMFFRFRANVWNKRQALKYIEFLNNYWPEIPLVLTFMRYKLFDNIHCSYEKYYDFKKDIINSYHSLNEKGWDICMEYFDKYSNIEVCGSKVFGKKLCKDCGLCEKHFWRVYNKEFKGVLND